MSTKTTTPSRLATQPHATLGEAMFRRSQVTGAEDVRQRIESMGRRINSYVQFMCQGGTVNGASVEASEMAVAAFLDRLVIAERQLARIYDEFKLA